MRSRPDDLSIYLFTQAGQYVPRFNNAQRWNSHAAQLTKLCPDHLDAFKFAAV
jgi:hypothetical protein